MAKTINHQAPPEANQGHGWVSPRADGKKERCGGPEGGCKACIEEMREAQRPFCSKGSVEQSPAGAILLGCAKQETHWGPCDYQRNLGLLEALKGDMKGAQLDRIELTKAGVPWFSCGWCGFSGPLWKGIEQAHADCETKKLGLRPAQMFDAKRMGLAYCIVKTSIDGGFGIVRQEPNADGGYRQEVLARDEDWDSVVTKLASFCGDMPLSVPGS
jgi:hypothetical protein